MPLVTVAHDGNLAVATISNPPVNAFSLELFEDLGRALNDIDESAARALLLRSEGPPGFSSGADVGMFVGKTTAQAQAMIENVYPVLWRLEDLPIPTMACVRGMCLAAGLEIALGCDLIIASDTARFGQVEAVVGTTTLLGGAGRLAQRAGPARALAITYTADTFSAADFERWNIVTSVVPDSQLDATAVQLAKSLADGPTAAHRVTKRIVRASIATGQRAADEAIPALAAPLFETRDMHHALAVLDEYGAREVRGHTNFTGS